MGSSLTVTANSYSAEGSSLQTVVLEIDADGLDDKSQLTNFLDADDAIDVWGKDAILNEIGDSDLLEHVDDDAIAEYAKSRLGLVEEE